ncbi:MAG: ABC transporter substrate-binding protein [Haloferacaceae archaeon]
MKRRRFIAAAGAAGIAGLAGCSGGGGNGSGGGSSGGGSSGSGTEGTTTGSSGGSTVDLRLWSGNMTDEPSNKEYWQNAIQRFNDQSDGVEINLRGVPYEGQFDKIRSGVQAGADSAPHIVEMASRKDTMLAADTLRIDGDLFEGSALSDAMGEGLMGLARGWGQQMTGEEGAIVCWPVGVRPYINCYRQNWLDAAGLSVDDVNLNAGTLSWDDMFQNVYAPMNETDLAAPSDAAPDTTGMKEGDEEIFAHYTGQMGITTMGTLNDAATHSILDTDAAREVVQFQIDGIDQGYFHPNSINHGDEEATTLQWSDKVGACHVQDVSDLWGSYRSELGADAYERDYTWGLPNQFEEKATYGLVPIMVPFEEAFTSQAERDAMVEFVDWFATDQQEPVRRVQKNGWIPVATDVLNADWFSSTSLHEKFWSVIKATVEDYTIVELPAVAGASAINFEIPRAMHQRILQQGMSVEEATTIAAEAQNDILRENGRYQAR